MGCYKGFCITHTVCTRLVKNTLEQPIAKFTLAILVGTQHRMDATCFKHTVCLCLSFFFLPKKKRHCSCAYFILLRPPPLSLPSFLRCPCMYTYICAHHLSSAVPCAKKTRPDSRTAELVAVFKQRLMHVREKCIVIEQALCLKKVRRVPVSGREPFACWPPPRPTPKKRSSTFP